MLPKITNLPQAVLRGRYMKAASVMEQTGIPLDVDLLERLRENWESIALRLTETEGIAAFGVYEDGHFKHDNFAAWLAKNGIPWPCLESGRLNLKDTVFELQAEAYPAIAPLFAVKGTLDSMRTNKLVVGREGVGRDGRNRAPLWAFGTKTGRNAPEAGKFIFGPSVWLRGLIKPPPGHGIAYVDWSQQEFGIAAALSGDRAMQAAYRSGDCHLAFGKQAGLLPVDATKESHPEQREFCKQCVFGVQYGMGEQGLAARIRQPPIVARELLKAHRRAFPQRENWSEHAVMHAMTRGSLSTVFGWKIHVGHISNARSLANFPMQANGSEMLRWRLAWRLSKASKSYARSTTPS